jgi:hypothetical protein
MDDFHHFNSSSMVKPRRLFSRRDEKICLPIQKSVFVDTKKKQKILGEQRLTPLFWNVLILRFQDDWKEIYIWSISFNKCCVSVW